MSSQEVLDTSVRFIIENSEFLTAEHIQALDNLWSKMQNTFPTLPPSPKEVVPPKTPESEEYYEEQESFKNIVVSSKAGALSTAGCDTLNAVVPVPHTFMPSQSVAPKVPAKYRPPYNDYRWPSPLPKVFVQHMRGRNAWDNYKGWRRYGGAWSADFKAMWLHAGNTEFRLTHDNCLRYLAYRCNCSVEEFMNKKPADVNAKFFSAYHGIPGHYVRRYHF